MGFHEIQTAVANLSPEERKKLAAQLVALRHRDIEGYREKMAAKIDDNNPDNWVTLEEFEKHLED